jgi:hypothetical protein
MLPKLASTPVLASATVGAALLSLGIAGVPLQALAAILLVAILPGIAVLRRIDPESITDARALAFVPALSFAVVIACGIVLHSLGAMHYWGWAIGLSMFTLAALAWDAVAGLAGDDTAGGSAAPQLTARAGPAGVDRRTITMFAAALGLLIAALAFTTYRAATHREFQVTEFWMTPDLRARSVYVLGLRNLTAVPQTYAIELTVGGRAHSKWGDMRVLPGQTWTTTFQAPEIPGTDRARADLFLQNEPNRVLRSVWLAPRQVQDSSTNILGPAAQPKP